MQLLVLQTLIEKEADEGSHIATPGLERNLLIAVLSRHEVTAAAVVLKVEPIVTCREMRSQSTPCTSDHGDALRTIDVSEDVALRTVGVHVNIADAIKTRASGKAARLNLEHTAFDCSQAVIQVSYAIPYMADALRARYLRCLRLLGEERCDLAFRGPEFTSRCQGVNLDRGNLVVVGKRELAHRARCKCPALGDQGAKLHALDASFTVFVDAVSGGPGLFSKIATIWRAHCQSLVFKRRCQKHCIKQTFGTETIAPACCSQGCKSKDSSSLEMHGGIVSLG